MLPINHTARIGYFHWNAGAWFGGQIGASAWLLAGTAALLPQHLAIAAIWFACCAVVNAVGTMLWLNRSRFRTHSALQILLGVTGVCAVLALYSANVIDPETVPEMGWPGNGYWALLIFPAMMIWFAVMEWGARRRNMEA